MGAVPRICGGASGYQLEPNRLYIYKDSIQGATSCCAVFLKGEEGTMAKKFGKSLLLLTAALIWGLAFVAQSAGTKYVGPYTFNSLRCFLGAAVLLPYIVFIQKGKRQSNERHESMIIGGICCGAFLFAGMSLQQIGIQYTSPGKAGFLTSLYIIIVPVISFLFLRRKCGPTVWAAVLMAVAGIYMLSINDKLEIGKGDMYMIMCALMFTCQIIVIDYFSTKADPVKLACTEFIVCGILSAMMMYKFETPDIENIKMAWKPILYTGVLSTGVAYTFQIVGQKSVNPTVASLLMSTESVFALAGGYVILGQQLTHRELLGCAMLLIAIVLAQIPSSK